MKNFQEKRERMLSMIAEWKSKKAYCSENGINEATFYYWFSRIKEIDMTIGSFIAINKSPGKSDIEIIYPNGVQCICYKPASIWYISEIYLGIP